VPASAPARICETGAFIDYLVESAPNNGRFARPLIRHASATSRFVLEPKSTTSFATVASGIQLLTQDLARGAFTHAPLALRQLACAMEVHRRFAEIALGLVDASVVALAEPRGIGRLATRDVASLCCHSSPIALWRETHRPHSFAPGEVIVPSNEPEVTCVPSSLGATTCSRCTVKLPLAFENRPVPPVIM
jgi:predicted nucleic acid-binding protein